MHTLRFTANYPGNVEAGYSNIGDIWCKDQRHVVCLFIFY